MLTAVASPGSRYVPPGRGLSTTLRDRHGIQQVAFTTSWIPCHGRDLPPASGLDVDERIFLDRIDKAFWNLRILGYEGRDVKKKTPAGIGEHTDFGILTFLLTDSCKQSLQVLNKTGEWVWADPIPVSLTMSSKFLLYAPLSPTTPLLLTLMLHL